MKIVHINTVDYGSSNLLINNISMYDNSIEHVLYVPVITNKLKDRNIKVKSYSYKLLQLIYYGIFCITENNYGLCFLSTIKLINRLKKEYPDIIHIHSLNCQGANFKMLMNYLNKNKIGIVITHHTEFLYTTGCTHSYECEKLFEFCHKCPKSKFYSKFKLDLNKRVWKNMINLYSNTNIYNVAVSKWQHSRIIRSPLLKNNYNLLIQNGINISNYKVDTNIIDSNKKSFILYVTSVFDSKDFDYKGSGFLSHIARNCKDINFIVISSVYINKEEIDNVQYISDINDISTMAYYYNNAKITLQLSKRETFGLTSAESLCCGTKIVGFKNGAIESFFREEYGLLYDFGHVNDLIKGLHEIYNDDYNCCKLARLACSDFDSNKMSEKYLDLYKYIYKESNKL